MAADALVEMCEDVNEVNSTLCGKSIRVQNRTATIGGLVKVVTWNKKVTLYAITAGHIFKEEKNELQLPETLVMVKQEKIQIRDTRFLRSKTR